MSNDTIAQRRSRAFEHLAGERDAAIKRAEAAEARAAELQIKINTFRAERDAADTLRIEAEDERDEARRQLEQAQKWIAELEANQHDPRVPIEIKDPRWDDDPEYDDSIGDEVEP